MRYFRYMYFLQLEILIKKNENVIFAEKKPNISHDPGNTELLMYCLIMVLTNRTLKQVFLIFIHRHRVPIPRDVFIDDSFDFVVVLRVENSRRSRAKLKRYVVALADAASWEFEPVGEYASAFVPRVVREQTMKTILLLASE